MIDDVPEFYNAWVTVMESFEHRLLYTWHADKIWRQNVCKISDVLKKKNTNKQNIKNYIINDINRKFL